MVQQWQGATMLRPTREVPMSEANKGRKNIGRKTSQVEQLKKQKGYNQTTNNQKRSSQWQKTYSKKEMSHEWYSKAMVHGIRSNQNWKQISRTRAKKNNPHDYTDETTDLVSADMTKKYTKKTQVWD